MIPRHDESPPRAALGVAVLHWRKTETTPASTKAGPDALAELGLTLPRASGRPVSTPTSSGPPAAALEAIRRQPLDTAVAERLVEDVVRRIEKRMRIERERRGIW
jgi:hypothetical protein